jgi:hypothetical protein
MRSFVLNNYQNSLDLTLKYRSKDKYEHIFGFPGYDFLHPVNKNTALKLIAKKLLSIKKYNFS